jgi:hypothetical protein
MATHQAVYVHTAQSGRHFSGLSLRDPKIIFFNKRKLASAIYQADPIRLSRLHFLAYSAHLKSNPFRLTCRVARLVLATEGARFFQACRAQLDSFFLFVKVFYDADP